MGDIQFMDEVQNEEMISKLLILQKMDLARKQGFPFTNDDIRDTQIAFGLTTENYQ